MANSVAPAGTVMRHPGVGGPFRRTMPDGSVQVFEPGVPVELTSEQMERVLKDIGHALVVVEVDEKNRPRIDWGLSKAVRDNDAPPVPASDEAESEIEIALSNELMDLIEMHADTFGDLSPVGLHGWLQAGGKLEDLDGFTPELITEFTSAMNTLNVRLLDRTKLLEAGLDDDLAAKLAANVSGPETQWLLDPAEIKTRVKSGFRLESLAEIGPVAAKKIKKALEIK